MHVILYSTRYPGTRGIAGREGGQRAALWRLCLCLARLDRVGAGLQSCVFCASAWASHVVKKGQKWWYQNNKRSKRISVRRDYGGDLLEFKEASTH